MAKRRARRWAANACRCRTRPTPERIAASWKRDQRS